MKKPLKLLALLLAGLTLAACGEAAAPAVNTPQAAEETTAAVTTEAETAPHDNVPELDFDGYTVRFLTSKTTSTYCITAITEQTGDILNDTMYDRTRWVENRFNVELAADVVNADATAAMNTLTNSVSAGDDAFDITMMLGRRAFANASEGYYYDQKTLPYIEFDRDWWFGDINRQVNLTEHNYISFGSLNLGVYDFMNVVLFNKDMLNRYTMDSPYDMVDSNTWIYDNFTAMAKAVIADLDGDGAMTDKDQYGIADRSNAALNNFITAARERTVVLDADNIPHLNIDGNARLFEIFERVSALYWDEGIWYTKTTSENDYYVKWPFFENGQSLFADRSLYSISKLRAMDSDFGIVPFPKYEESQDAYGIMIEAGGRATAIPNTIKKPEVVGAVLEALNFYSYTEVVPAYYEISLKQKYSRDNDSGRMFDLVLDSIYYDLGNTMFCDTVKDGVLNLFRTGGRDLASSVASKSNAVQDAIDKALGNK